MAKAGISYAKRFNVTGVTRIKNMILPKEMKKVKCIILAVNANGEAEVVKIILSPDAMQE